jgi:hypothetical protein
MIPSRLFETIASSDESTIAASRNPEELPVKMGETLTLILLELKPGDALIGKLKDIQKYHAN